MSVEDEIKLMCTPCQLFQKGRCLIVQNQKFNAAKAGCEKAIITDPKNNQLLALKRIRAHDGWIWSWKTQK